MTDPAGQPPTTAVRRLADRVFDRQLEVDALTRVAHGLAVQRLRIGTPAAQAEDAAFARAALGELAAAVPEAEDDLLTAGYLEHVLGVTLAQAENPLLGFGVTPYMGGWLMSTTALRVLGQGPRDAEAFRALAADLRDVVREARDRLMRQREAGILVPRPALPGCRAALAGAQRATTELLASHAPPDLGPSSVMDEVAGAFDALLACLDEGYERDAPTAVGLGQYPGGEEHYRALVREHTAGDATPEELHQLGLAEVAELAERMAALRAGMGFAGSEAELHAQLRTDPRVHAQDPADVDALFARHMAALEPRLGDWFAVLPRAPYGAKRLPPDKEAGMTYGFYEPPSPAEPTGYYYWNGADLASKSLLTYASLAFHELAPGHHFHLARQRENDALPEIRRTGHLGAFNEGWAEYASGLGWEMGLYADPLDAYGKLVHERFTAQRLVVDTGLNALGWSLDRAAAFMRAHTTESDAQIASEVLRYSTDLPAQALSYRAGYLALKGIRSRAEDALGTRFDVRAFHERVLAPGALPFPVVEAHVQRWVASELQGAAR